MIEFIKLYEIILVFLVCYRVIFNCINWIYFFRSLFKGFLDRFMVGCFNLLINDIIMGCEISYFYFNFY